MGGFDHEDIVAFTEAWFMFQLIPDRERELIPPEALEFLSKHKDVRLAGHIDLLLPLEKQKL